MITIYEKEILVIKTESAEFSSKEFKASFV